VNKTMTESCLLHKIQNASSSKALAESLVGTTIIADPEPEPRPDFASMTSSDLMTWIYQNGDTHETRMVYVWLHTHALNIADRKQMK
jgi:hypothetical protein